MTSLFGCKTLYYTHSLFQWSEKESESVFSAKISPVFQKKIVFLENTAFFLFFPYSYVPSSHSVICISCPDVRWFWTNLEVFVLNLEVIHIHIE